MKKTRVLSFIAALLMTISIMGANGTQASAAGGCGNWEMYKVGTAYCDTNDGCGFLWLKDTYKQRKYYKCTCVDAGNKIFYKYRSELEDLGCC